MDRAGHADSLERADVIYRDRAGHHVAHRDVVAFFNGLRLRSR
jgi:hypothetical protein